MNTEPPKDVEEPEAQPAEVTADSGGVRRPPVKRKLVSELSSSRVVRAKPLLLRMMPHFFPYLMMMRKGHLDNKIDLELLDLHDRYYAWQAVVDNGINMRAPAMAEFDHNHAVLALWEKFSSLTADVKEHKEADKARFEAIKASLRRKVEELKQDRRDVFSKVVPYAAIKLVHSDELGKLVFKLVSSAITYGRCRAYEQVAAIKDPFDLS
nr:hypothetical protein [Tanacetum cinerariifolium]